MSHYPVYLIEYLGVPRNHHAIFVATQRDDTGTLFHVKGSVQTGMAYEVKALSKPVHTSNSFVSKLQLGWIRVGDLSHVDSVCRANPPPEKQFNGPKRINKNKPLRRCQEWTAETIKDLRAGGILLDGAESGAGDPTRGSGSRSSGADGGSSSRLSSRSSAIGGSSSGGSFRGSAASYSSNDRRSGARQSSATTEPRDGTTRDGYWFWSANYQRWYHDNGDGTYEWS